MRCIHFFSNVYNSFAIDLIVKHPCKQDLFGNCGPISGIRDIGTTIPYKSVWDKPAGTLAGKVWSLQDIEDYLITPPQNYKADPRVHSAIVCASVSCPDLRRGAYNYSDIDRQFNESFNNWISNQKKGMQIDTANIVVKLSLTFDWYQSMFVNYFEDGNGSVVRFILLYINNNSTDVKWLSDHKDSVTIQYFDYDWNVNVDGKVPCDSANRPCYPLWALLVTIAGVVVVIIVVVIVIFLKKKKTRKHSYHRINT